MLRIFIKSTLFKEIIFICIMNIFKNYFNIILKYANEYKSPKHNTKFTNEYYLNHILGLEKFILILEKSFK